MSLSVIGSLVLINDLSTAVIGSLVLISGLSTAVLGSLIRGQLLKQKSAPLFQFSFAEVTLGVVIRP